jgi:transcriptional regulator with XRE-family HTH domain
MARTRGWSGDLSLFGEYLKRHGVDRKKVADGVNVTPSYISMLAHGNAKPGFSLALAIDRWTLANVKADGEPAPFTVYDWAIEAAPSSETACA